MKMANAKKCDVCGKLYDDNTFDDDRIQIFHIVRKYHDAPYDLCNACYHKLLKFLHEDGEQDD